jgi:hypothetical protein
MKMSRAYAAMIVSAVAAIALPTAASAGCYNCYAPPQPCGTCYQQQVAPAQYRAVQETVMVPQTVMVAPESVQYERIPAQYETRQRVEMVAPARTYYVPAAPRCNSCGY